VLLVGNPGTGKSHLAIGLAAAACARGYRVRFFRVTELVTLLIEAATLHTRARIQLADLADEQAEQLTEAAAAREEERESEERANAPERAAP